MNKNGRTLCLNFVALGEGEVGGEEVVVVNVRRGRHLEESTREELSRSALKAAGAMSFVDTCLCKLRCFRLVDNGRRGWAPFFNPFSAETSGKNN